MRFWVMKPGMFINAEIEYDRRENARIIPFSAIVTRGYSQGVFVADIENKKAYFKAIKTGIIEGEKAEVVEPADLSGYVVTLGQHLLQDGMGIILPELGIDTSSSQPDNKSSDRRG